MATYVGKKILVVYWDIFWSISRTKLCKARITSEKNSFKGFCRHFIHSLSFFAISRQLLFLLLLSVYWSVLFSLCGECNSSLKTLKDWNKSKLSGALHKQIPLSSCWLRRLATFVVSPPSGFIYFSLLLVCFH